METCRPKGGRTYDASCLYRLILPAGTSKDHDIVKSFSQGSHSFYNGGPPEKRIWYNGAKLKTFCQQKGTTETYFIKDDGT